MLLSRAGNSQGGFDQLPWDWNNAQHMNLQTFYAVTEKSQVGEARRRIGELAERLNFGPTASEKVAITVTELATNLLKHAGEGELVVRALYTEQNTGIEILALDRGPGMANIGECLRDGYSTTGSLGQGLGAIKRLSTHFDCYSAPGLGSVLLVQLWAQSVTPPPVAELFVSGAISRPKPGEESCGDGWSLHTHRAGFTLLVCDGLGHGPEAAAATQQALRTFLAQPLRPAIAQMEDIHAALRTTRGAAVAVAAVTVGPTSREPASGGVEFVGVGNISGRVMMAEETRHLLSQNGIAGHQARKIQGFPQQWTKGALLILHSDGLGTRWNLAHYPGLRQRHPSLIAAVLYRDFTRGNDDATVVVVKEL